MTTILPQFIEKVAGAGAGQGLPAKGPEKTISAPPAHPPHVSTAPVLRASVLQK